MRSLNRRRALQLGALGIAGIGTVATSELHPTLASASGPVAPVAMTGTLVEPSTSIASTVTFGPVGGPTNIPVCRAAVYPWAGSAASWSTPTAAASAVKGDLSCSLGGETSLTITTRGDGAFMTASHSGRTSFDFSAHRSYALGVWVRADNPTALKAFSIAIGSAAGNGHYCDLITAPPTADKPTLFPGRWRRLTLQPCFMTTQGAPVDTSLTRISVNLQDAGSPATVRISDFMEWEPCACTLFPSGVVSMDFDDSSASVKLAIPVLNRHGWRASLVPITDFVGRTGMLTWDEVKDVQNNLGWPIKSHCRFNSTPIAEHVGFTTLTAAQMVDAITGNREILMGNGLWGSEHWAAPNGTYGIGAQTQQMVTEILAPYIDTARITQNLRPIGTLPPANRMMLENKSDVGGPSNPITNYTAGTQGILDKVAASGGWTHLTFHALISAGTPTLNQITVADFTTLCTAIAAKGIPVLPTAEVIDALR